MRYEELLFAAFRAGFDASGEGWNGEYVNSSVTSERLTEQLRKIFDEWRQRLAQEAP